MKTQNLLLEIGCEELPTQAVKILADHLADRLSAQLKSALLIEDYIQPKIFATPRRLAVYIEEVSTQQKSEIIKKQGPAIQQAYNANGEPTQAALGFARSCGVDIAKIAVKDNRLYFEGEKSGQKTTDILPELVRLAIIQLPIPKPMRWGSHKDSFARPVHWIVLIFGKELVKVSLFDIQSDNRTYGHRFHHSDAIVIEDPKNYAELLRKGHVIADFNERQQKICKMITAITPPNLQVEIDPDLLHEVTSLVEWPVALMGHFNPEFLKVPAEALITSMKINQKYFPVLDKQEQLQPSFVLISNIEGKDSELIVHGNERVLNARLTDAAFFFKNDCQHSLQSQLPHLEHVIFQKQLGSLAHKTERIVTLAGFIAQQIGANLSSTQQAAQLCKCDLLSEMVGEFPTLQGTMGYYYALNDGLDETCATAIKEHYYPRFANDALPNNLEGCAVALADKLDTLVGIFGINQAPTGDKDPFALRRTANGIIQILINKNLALDLKQLLQQAKLAYKFHLPNHEVESQALDFILQRLKSICLEKQYTSEQFSAVLACQASQPVDFMLRIEAVREFQQLPEAAALAAANKRVSNILRKQAAEFNPPAININLYEQAVERELAEQLNQKIHSVSELVQQKHYQQALNQLSSLKEPVDLFFDKVMVMVDNTELRNNRLTMLASLHRLFTQVADISLL